MQRASVVGVGLAFLAPAVSAQPRSDPNDPQRRAYVVPYVRRATDCLAGQLIGSADLVDIVRGNRIRNALVEPFRVCADEIDAMIAAHDRAWFPGAGEQFFRGPYLADVPRAVQQRLQKEVERREQEASRVVAEAAQREAAAAEQRKAADALAAKLWAENDRRQALARQAAASPAAVTPTRSREVEVQSDPRVQITSNARDAAEQRISPLWYGFAAAIAFLTLHYLFRRWREQSYQNALDAAERARIEEDQARIAALERAELERLAAIERARQDRHSVLMAKYGDALLVDRLMHNSIWQGMTAEHLEDSRGHPEDVDTDVSPKRTREIYKYDEIGVGRYRCRVTLHDGVVVRFSERGA